MFRPMSRAVKTALKTTLAIALALGLSHCGKAGDSKGADKAEPSKTAYAYDVALSFTPAALAKLKTAKVVVSGFYFGMPTAEAKDKASEDGRIPLGEDEVTVDAKDQSVHLTGYGLDPAVLTAVEGGQPQVEVRAYSETTAKNVLKCTTFKDLIKTAQAKPVAITCDAAK